jgi:hypothetical protein
MIVPKQASKEQNSWKARTTIPKRGGSGKRSNYLRNIFEPNQLIEIIL